MCGVHFSVVGFAVTISKRYASFLLLLGEAVIYFMPKITDIMADVKYCCVNKFISWILYLGQIFRARLLI